MFATAAAAAVGLARRRRRDGGTGRDGRRRWLWGRRGWDRLRLWGGADRIDDRSRGETLRALELGSSRACIGGEVIGRVVPTVGARDRAEDAVRHRGRDQHARAQAKQHNNRQSGTHGSSELPIGLPAVVKRLYPPIERVASLQHATPPLPPAG